VHHAHQRLRGEAFRRAGGSRRVFLEDVDLEARGEERRDVPAASDSDQQDAASGRQRLDKRADERMW
jgi:hypothetical protein